jgi:penicillin-binding protein 1A
MEAKTCYVRALVGGRDFEDSKFNRATQALRQAGSTFKPFVYSAAIRAGYTFAEVVNDEPLSIPVENQANWEPQNYDNTFKGPMTLRQALFDSRNTVAVTMGMRVGEDVVVAEAHRFGLTSRIPPVPSIHIGAADVLLIDMVAAYTAFANMGVLAARHPGWKTAREHSLAARSGGARGHGPGPRLIVLDGLRTIRAHRPVLYSVASRC